MSDSENLEIIPDETLPDESAGQTGGSAPDTLRILEAVIFASDELITSARLKTILPGNPDAREIGRLVERINRTLQKERHPFEIVDIGGGYQFKTVAYYHPWVRQIFQDKAAKRLSIQALECLSIIAYRQPLSKAEIEGIRGVLSDGAMKTLLEKRLITVVGRSEKAGKPLLYGTTQDFLKYFGLNKIADLPKIEEFEAMVRAKMENLPIEELQQVPAASDQQIETEGAGEEASFEIIGPAKHEQQVAEELKQVSTDSKPQTEAEDAPEEASIEINVPVVHAPRIVKKRRQSPAASEQLEETARVDRETSLEIKVLAENGPLPDDEASFEQVAAHDLSKDKPSAPEAHELTAGMDGMSDSKPIGETEDDAEPNFEVKL